MSEMLDGYSAKKITDFWMAGSLARTSVNEVQSAAYSLYRRIEELEKQNADWCEKWTAAGHEILELKQELEEQSRLHGMGMQREALLMATNKALEKQIHEFIRFLATERDEYGKKESVLINQKLILKEALEKIANDEGMCGAYVCKDAANQALSQAGGEGK